RRDSVGSLVLLLGDGADAAARDPRAAVELARDAVAHAPADPASDLDLDAGSAWNILGFALACDGRWKEALEAASRSAELGYRGDGTDGVYEAPAQATLGNVAAARDLYERADAWFAEPPQTDQRFARRRAEVAELLAAAERR